VIQSKYELMYRSLFKYILVFFVFTGMSFLHVYESRAQPLDFSSFLIDTQEDYLVAMFSIDIEEFEKIQKALHDGNKISMICTIKLKRHRTLFWNKNIQEKTIEVDMAKDLLSEEYMIKFPDKTYTLKKLQEDSFDALFENISIKLAPLEELMPQRDYKLHIGIRVISKDVPQWIKSTLFFLSWDVVPEVRYEKEFSF